MAILSESNKVASSHNEEAIYKLGNDVSADETTSDAIETSNVQAVTLIVEAGAGVSGGVVHLEGAVSSDYAGTWASLGSVTTSAASKVYALSVGSFNDVGSNDVALPMPYLRTRVETAISGGTVDIYLVVRK